MKQTKDHSSLRSIGVIGGFLIANGLMFALPKGLFAFSYLIADGSLLLGFVFFGYLLGHNAEILRSIDHRDERS